MKHIICFSGGHSSALVALEVADKFGTENMILLNHDINSKTELEDIKRFKMEMANYLNLPITYANYENTHIEDHLDVCIKKKAFSIKHSNGDNPICSNALKTKLFYKWLNKKIPTVPNGLFESEDIIYYGFDSFERNRIERRTFILKEIGYKSDYPLALWYKNDINLFNEQKPSKYKLNNLSFKYEGERKYLSTEEIGIKPPLSYSLFKHANCLGCVKAGQQHWYLIFCLYPEIFEKAKFAEMIIGYSIIKNHFLKDLEIKFKQMKELGIEPTEKIDSFEFWSNTKKKLKSIEIDKEEILQNCRLECIG